ncbi:MAG: hypothetical protein GF409_01775 [Candidatus Omnitrophica bacterium]|nr:hypothetical protein [Candidatus Omnitrophota bacterium]
MKYPDLVAVVLVCFMLAGCSGIESPNTDEFLKQPLGNGGLELGMTKDHVEDMYGEPNGKRMVKSGEWKEPREEWFYKATVSALPMNAGYLSDDLYLYFDGDNLTNISKRPMGKSADDLNIK